MKQLFLSAFAVSLILTSSLAWSQVDEIDEFLGLEAELMPELQGSQKFTPQNLHADKSWRVNPKKVESDSQPLKGQKHSIIPWETQSVDDFLDAKLWIRERDLKDKLPDWKLRLRQDRHAELMGKILACHGSCLIYRGTNPAHGQHLSRILEGDELHVEKDSVAWVFMMDGTLLRVSSLSSVTFQEIDLTKTEAFYHLRLNQGHAFWHPRQSEKFILDEAPETDAIVLPLMVKEANLQHFERKIFQAGSDAAHLGQIFSLEKDSVAQQFEDLNQRLVKNTETLKLKSRVMFVAPNVTIDSVNAGFDLLFWPGNKSYFKKRSVGEEFSATLRGYAEVTSLPVTEVSWQEVDATGKIISQASTDLPVTEVSELLTKRIQSIELAREVWIEKFTLPLIADLGDAKKLAIDQGYSLWEDLTLRRNYLSEYNRRIETTNLRSLDNLLTKLEADGQPQSREFSAEIYQPSLNDYLKGLKSRYTVKNVQVRQMNDVQYYVWVLKNAKRQTPVHSR
jgi:hypothetical protein